MEQKPLRRSRTDRRLAGVCAGMATHWNLDPLKVRLAVGSLAIAGIFTVGISTMFIVALYAFAWFLIPEEDETPRDRLEL